MSYIDLLTSIGRKSHSDPFAENKDRIKEAVNDAISELSQAAAPGDIQMLISDKTGTITGGVLEIDAAFESILRIKNSRSPSYRFALVDYNKWQMLGVISEEDPPENTIYYTISGSNILFYKETTPNGLVVSVTYLTAPDATNWEDYKELIGTGTFTTRFLVAVKNRAVQILKLDDEGEMK